MPNYYLRTALGRVSLLEEHAEAIHRLTHNDYALADLEKLSGYDNIYSFRLNRTERLLLSTVMVDGQQFWLVLEHLPTHDYEKSRFLKSGVLRNYLQKHQAALQAQAHEFVFVKLAGEGERPVVAAGDEAAPIVLDVYQQHIIQLSDRQQEAVQLELPALISGSPGSGKSCVALQLFINFVMQQRLRPSEEPFALLYVTELPSLVSAMKKAWYEHPIADQIGNGVVHFLSYGELLARHQDLAGKTVVGRDDFNEWHADFLKNHELLARARAFVAEPELPTLPDEETVYQEFRICSAHDLDGYLKLGKRQSMLPSPADRNALYVAYQSYKRTLDCPKYPKINPAFHHWNPEGAYDLIAVDESQDESHLQAIMLAGLAKQGQVAYCIDSHQSLYDQISIRPYLLEMLKMRFGRVSHIELPVTYRCPQKIADATNVVIKCKHLLTGGKSDRQEPTEIFPTLTHKKQDGHFILCAEEEAHQNHWMGVQAQGTNLVVVTRKESRERARELFKTPLVFTIEDIKGLEYKFVIGYELFPEAIFQAASARLHELGDVAAPQHRAKAGDENPSFRLCLNNILTCITRATTAFVLIQTPTRSNHFLMEKLGSIADADGLCALEQREEQAEPDWAQEIMKHMERGNVALARSIYLDKVNSFEDTFNAFIAEQKARYPYAGLLKEQKNTSVLTLQPQSSKESPPSEKKSEQRKKLKAQEEAPIIHALVDVLGDFTHEKFSRCLTLMGLQTNKFMFDVNIQGVQPQTNFFQHLLQSHEKARQCIAFLEGSPVLAQQVATPYFLQKIQDLDKGDKRKKLPEDLKAGFLRVLLMSNPDLLKDSYLSSWFASAIRSSPNREGRTLLLWITQQPSGPRFLHRLVREHPKLYAAIPNGHWALALNEKAGLDENDSPLYELSSNPEGLVFLDDQLKCLVPKMSSLCWGLARSAAIEPSLNNTSPLYYLCLSERGRNILRQLIGHYPIVVSEIPTEAWIRTVALVAASPLSLLSQTIEGHHLLQRLFHTNAALLQAIPPDAWELALSSQQVNSEVLDKLHEAFRKEHAKPIQMTKLLHDFRLARIKSFFRLMTPELMLYLFDKPVEDISPPKSFFRHIFDSPEKAKVFVDCLSQDSKIAEQLATTRGLNALALVEDKAGKHYLKVKSLILRELLLMNFELFTHKYMFNWFVSKPVHLFKDKIEQTLMSWIIHQPRGIAFCDVLLEHNPPALIGLLFSSHVEDHVMDLMSVTGNEAFILRAFETFFTEEYQVAMKGASADIMQRSVAQLTTSVKGQLILLKLFEEHPDYLRLLMSKCYSPSNNSLKDRASWLIFSNLVKTTIGHKILLLINDEKETPTFFLELIYALTTICLRKKPMNSHEDEVYLAMSFDEVVPLEEWCEPPNRITCILKALESVADITIHLTTAQFFLRIVVADQQGKLPVQIKSGLFINMLMANSELIHVSCVREWLKDALCSTTSDDHVLFKLTVYEEGRSILSHLLKDYPSMIYDIPPQAWVQTGPNGYFPIFCLCSSTNGQKILQKIYETVPNTYKKIPMMAWITPCEGEHNTSSLYWLVGLNGRIGSALTFPLHWLIGLNGSIGSALLNVLFSEGYLQYSLLSADRLGLMVSAPILCLNANLLGFLCVTNYGQHLLSSLLNRNPTLVLQIHKEAWLAPLQFTSEETLNIFQCLSKLEVGQLIIKQILSNPNVAPEVKEAASSLHLGTVEQGLDRAQSVATTSSFFPKVVSGKTTTGDSIQSTLKPE